MNKMLLEAEIKSVDEGGIFEVIASSGKADRMGDTIDPNGWYLGNYKKNPVMLWAHNNYDPPIARADKVWVENGKELKLQGHFAETPFAQQIKQLVQGGFLNAVSVGFMPLVADEKGKIDIEGKMYRRAFDKEIEKGAYGKDNGTHFEKQELLEVSWVNVPALASALVTARKMNLDLVTKALEDIEGEEGEEETPEEVVEPLVDQDEETEEPEVDEEEDEVFEGMKELKKDLANKFIELETKLSNLEGAISELKVLIPNITATSNEEEKGRNNEEEIKSNEAQIKLLRMADKVIETLLVQAKKLNTTKAK